MIGVRKNFFINMRGEVICGHCGFVQPFNSETGGIDREQHNTGFCCVDKGENECN